MKSLCNVTENLPHCGNLFKATVAKGQKILSLRPFFLKNQGQIGKNG